MTEPFTHATAILANAPILMSILKPLLLIATYIAFLRYAPKFEADARMFNLPVLGWNAVYVAAVLVSLTMVLVIPWFFVGWVLALFILVMTAMAYWKYRDARVPPNRKFTFGGEKFSTAMAARKQAAADRAATATFTRADGSRESVPQKEDPALAVYVAVEQLLLPPLGARASRLDLTATQSGVLQSSLIDGVRAKGEALPPTSAPPRSTC